MGKYLKLFGTHTEYEAYMGGVILPNVSYCVQGNEVHYNPLPYQGFCKLTLNDRTTVELEGSGELTQAMVSNQYKDTLVSAEIGELCTSIGVGAFNGCASLTSVTIGNGVTSIDNGAFSACSGLTSITIPNSVTSIGNQSFVSCSGLTSITIPNSVTSIGYNTFQNCSGLRSATIGNGVTSIGYNAFYNCSDLASIVVDSNNTVYDSRGNCNAIIETATNTLISGFKNTIIPNSVTSIGERAFWGCTTLTSITIPSGVTSIGGAAFSYCSSLTNITSLATTAPTIANHTFQGVKTNGTLTVPSGSSGYDTWMQNANYYLGLYNWTKVEQ